MCEAVLRLLCDGCRSVVCFWEGGKARILHARWRRKQVTRRVRRVMTRVTPSVMGVKVCVVKDLLMCCAFACVEIQSQKSGMVMILADEMWCRNGDNIALTLIAPVSDRRGVWLCRHGEP